MNLYAIVLGIIVLTLLAVSLARVSKVKTKADYLVAGRSLPAVVLIFTLLSSWIGSGSLLAGAENAYKHGFPALWQAAGGWAGLLLIYFIAPRARKFAQFTIPDLLEARYNQTARVLGVIAVLFAYTAITSYQLIGGGDILHLVFPSVTARHGQEIIATFVIIFTAIAGMSSVAYMDVAIGLLGDCDAAGCAADSCAYCGWLVFGDLGPARYTLSGSWGLHGGPGAGTVFAYLPADAWEPVDVSEVFLGEDRRRTLRGLLWDGLSGLSILETVIVAIAVVGSALFRSGEVSENPREILAYTALHALPHLLGAIMVGAIFAKVISTANNYLFSPGDEPHQ